MEKRNANGQTKLDVP